MKISDTRKLGLMATVLYVMTKHRRQKQTQTNTFVENFQSPVQPNSGEGSVCPLSNPLIIMSSVVLVFGAAWEMLRTSFPCLP